MNLRSIHEVLQKRSQHSKGLDEQAGYLVRIILGMRTSAKYMATEWIQIDWRVDS